MKICGKIHDIGSVGLEDGGVIAQGMVVLSNGIPTDWLTSLLIRKIIIVRSKKLLLDEYSIMRRCKTRNYC